MRNGRTESSSLKRLVTAIATSFGSPAASRHDSRVLQLAAELWSAATFAGSTPVLRSSRRLHRRRKGAWRSSTASLYVAFSLLLSACDGAQEPPPNIVLISVDTLNRSALRAFDEEAQPLRHLDTFAATAARFPNVYSPASWTLPAHASLMTGLYPDRHGAVVRGRGLPEGIQTLAASLKEHGYETVGFTGGGYVHARLGFSTGFDRYDNWSTAKANATTGNTEREASEPARTGRELFQRGIDYMRQRSPRDPPFFLFLHTYAVHDYFKLHPWAVAQLPKFDDPEPPAYLECLIGQRSCPTEKWQRLERLYDAELRNLDEGFGRLLDVVETTSTNTVILLLSDHGEGFDPARGRIHHGGRLHEDLVRVPLLIRGPGIVAEDVKTRVSLVDVMPTLLELASSRGANVRRSSRPVESMDGRSFVSELFGETRPTPPVGRPLFAHEHFHTWERGRRLSITDGVDRVLAVAVVLGDSWYIDGTQGEELYRMTDDPDQIHNLAHSAGNVAELRKLARARRETRKGDAVVLDNEIERQLRALGYLQ